FAVDVTANRRVADVDLVARNRERTHWTERILRFPDEPLAVPRLQIARGYIVDDRVAPDMLEGVFRRDAAAALAHNNGEFRLVVDGVGNLRIDDHRAAAGDQRLGYFGKQDGVLWHRAIGDTGVEAALREFMGVFAIVLPNAENVPARARDRCFEQHLRKR